jgi:hypothetical protein
MAAAKRGERTAPIISAEDPGDTLADLCQDLDHWPHSWRYDDTDLVFGRRLVDFFTPFLLDLLARRPARKTLLRHRDHLWMLGGEIVRRRREDSALPGQSIEQLVLQVIDDDCGPLIWPRITEPQQNAFDATCRKLYKFLTTGAKTASQGQ